MDCLRPNFTLILLNLKFLYFYLYASSLFKFLSFDNILHNLFHNHFSIPLRTLRSNSQQTFDIPLINGRAYESTFLIVTMKLWNDLPIAIRNSDTENMYKSTIFKYLYCLENNQRHSKYFHASAIQK